MADLKADTGPDRMFDAALAQRAPDLLVAAEDETHRSFLTDLFIAGSPLRGVLPDAVVLHQAAIRETGYRNDYPDAMRRVVLADGQPIARIMVDWAAADGASLVDVAVSPDRQGSGVGSAMLGAYLDVADARLQRAILQVQPDNRAAQLYTRLGFVAVDTEEFSPFIDMVREPRG